MEFYPLSELEAKTNPEVLAKAKKMYKQESLNIKLKALRGKYDIKQKDIKISTLIEYLESLGFGLEITALPKTDSAVKKV